MIGSGSGLQYIDDALSEWNNRLAAVAESLLELQADPTYRTLTGAGGGPRLQVRGVTAGRVEPALGGMLGIYEQFRVLQEMVEQAGKLRKALPSLFGVEQRVGEIRRLLFERSVAVPKVDSGQPSFLLSAPQAAPLVTAAEMLAGMVGSFTAARDAVLAVGDAWRELAESVERMDSEITWLEGQCGAADRALLKEARRMVLTIREESACDPLGAVADYRKRVQPLMAGVTRAIDAAERMRLQMQAGRGLLKKLEMVRADGVTAMDAAVTRVEGYEGVAAPMDEARLQMLAEWMERLEARRVEGRLEAVAVGLRNWLRVVEECTAQETRCGAEWRGLVELRNELRGRLEALRAKARSYGLAEAAEMVEVGKTAEELLHARPVNLKLAAAAVASYEKRLSGARGRA